MKYVPSDIPQFASMHTYTHTHTRTHAYIYIYTHTHTFHSSLRLSADSRMWNMSKTYKSIQDI